MNLKKLLLRRIIEIFVVFYIIMTILFLLFHLAPGDPVSMMVDLTLTPEDVELLVAQLGLDQPLWLQYLYYIKNFFTGNFGVSFHYGRPVIEIIAQRLPPTLLLFTTATILAAVAGVWWGKLIAWYKGKSVDTGVTIFALVCNTLFLPWIALLFIWFFAYRIGWFPLSGMMTPEIWVNPAAGFLSKAGDVLRHMLLPLMTLFVVNTGAYLLIMRSSMLETLREDYILTARAKGLTERQVRNRHAAPNASLPVVTSVGLSLAFSVNGGALTETVFSWPGIGRELIFAVSNADYPLAMASFLFIALVVLVANLIVDILYAYLDPRISYE